MHSHSRNSRTIYTIPVRLWCRNCTGHSQAARRDQEMSCLKTSWKLTTEEAEEESSSRCMCFLFVHLWQKKLIVLHCLILVDWSICIIMIRILIGQTMIYLFCLCTRRMLVYFVRLNLAKLFVLFFICKPILSGRIY